MSGSMTGDGHTCIYILWSYPHNFSGSILIRSHFPHLFLGVSLPWDGPPKSQTTKPQKEIAVRPESRPQAAGRARGRAPGAPGVGQSLRELRGIPGDIGASWDERGTSYSFLFFE